MNDFRYALRTLAASPAFALAAVGTLAIGIALNTITFTLVNVLTLRPMPVRDAARVVRFHPVNGQGRRENLFAFRDYLDYRAQSTVIEALAAYRPFDVTIGEAEPRQALAYAVSDNFFSALGIELSLGRAIGASDHQGRDASPVAIISYDHWVRRLNADPKVVGSTIRVNGLELTIIGVGSRRFMGTEPLLPDVWIPLTLQRIISPQTDLLADDSATWLLCVGRLRPGVSEAIAAQALSSVAGRLATERPGKNRPIGIAIAPGTFFPLNGDEKWLIAVVMTIVGLVLLIAAANITNLVIARLASRQRELAIRLAVGANRWRIVRQLMIESALVAFAASAVGLLLASWTMRVLYPIGLSLLPFGWGVILDVAPDVRVLAYTILLGFAAALAFGLVPAMQASSTVVSAALHDEGTMLGVGLRRSRVRNGLVVVQIALSLMLLITAGLLVRGLQHARALDLGFRADGVAYADYDLVRHDYTPVRAIEFQNRILARVARLSGVSSVALTSRVPLTGGVRRTAVDLEGTADAGGESVWSTYTFVTPSYFDTLGIPIVAGRNFTRAETTAGVPVALISETLAHRFWPREEAIGQKLKTDAVGVVTVIGIARDASDVALWREKELSLYLPPQTGADYLKLRMLVHTTGSLPLVMNELRAEARAADADVRVAVTPLAAELRLWILPSKVAAIAAGIVGFLGALLASLGLYGVLAFVVGRRTHEFGIRLALGAEAADVLQLVLREATKLVATGVALGLLGSVGSSRLLRSALFGVNPVDPLTFVAVPLLLAAVALGAAYMPARRATKIDPLAALRTE
jgi:putative ABC transport system permease protein